MTRLPLGQVTLCAVDTRTPALAAQSLMRSLAGVQFGRAILFTHGWLPRRELPGIELIEIEPIASGADHSRFVLRRLPGYIRSSHALITQWDGFVVDPAAWTDEFLVHDYVGAVWPDQPAAQCVGDGGFSLRSRRFLAAGLDPRITELHPEDQVMCRHHRRLLESDHGVRFAPPALARRFAFGAETTPGPAFGFHGAHHLASVLLEAELGRWLDLLPADFYASPAALRLARALLARRMPAAAARVVERRRAGGNGAAAVRILGAAASLLARLPGRR